MKTAALRAAARMAWRDAVRNRWRSLLVLAMIALPIAGLTVAGIVMDTTIPTDAEVATGEMGTADVGIYDWDDSLTIQDVLDGLPDGISAVRRSWDTRILAEGSIQYVTVEDVAPTDEVVGAIYRLTGGRAPVSQGEIAVSPAILEGFALGIGDDISLGDIGNTYRVVGTVVKPEHLGKGVAVVAPGSLDAQPGARLDGIFVRFQTGTLPSDIDAALTTGKGIYGYQLRRDLSNSTDSPSTNPAMPFGVTALVLAETGLIAAAAFVVGARRQTRTIGLVGAAGGEPRHACAVVLAGGIMLGLLGSLAGIALGIGAVVALSPHFDTFAGRLTGPIEFSPLLLIGAVVLGVAAATLAALAPALAAAKVETIDALAGRTLLPRPPARLARVGLVAVALGAVLTAWTTATDNDLALGAALLLTVAGFLIMIPMLVTWIGRIATRLPLAPRVATRDAARHGRRTSPAVAAATVALMLPVAVSTLTLSEEAKENADPALADDQVIVEVAVRGADEPDVQAQALLKQMEDRVFPGAVVAPISMLRYSEDRYPLPPELADRRDELPVFGVGIPQKAEEGFTGKFHVGNARLLTALHAESYAADLEAGWAIVFSPDFVDQGVIHMHIPSPDETLEWTYVDLPVKNAAAGLFTIDFLPGIVISSQLAAELGLEADAAVQYVIRATDAVTDDQLAAAKKTASSYSEAYVMGLEDTKTTAGRLLRTAILASSGLIALGIVAVAVALVSTETRRDQAILTAIGSAPGTRRKIIGSSALVLTGLAGVLAAPAGFLPAAVFRIASQEGYPLVVPWAAIAAVVLAVPLVAGGIAAIVSRPPPAARLLRPLA